MNANRVGNGKVVLIYGGGQSFTGMAASFCRSEKELDEIVASDYNRNLVRTILNSGHLAATEFDYYIFGIEGYSRVTEVQLVRKRLASYLIKSGRVNKHGKRDFSIIIPDKLEDFAVDIPIYIEDDITHETTKHDLSLNALDIAAIIEAWYDKGVALGYNEEDLRYLKPQATEFKAIIGMNAHALLDWFKIRCCKNAQTEIRDLANKMLSLCKQVSPDVFEDAGPSCKVLGYCPENKYQNPQCSGKMIKKEDALRILKDYYESSNTDT